MTSDQTAEVINVPEVAKVPEVIKVPELSLHETALAIAAANPTLEVRPTESSGYRILGTVLNGLENWKKGMFYVINKNAKGLRIELQLYSTKKGAHLAEFAPRFKKFGNVDVGENPENLTEYTPFGLAGRVRMLLPNSQGLDKVVENATKFINLTNPEVEEVRALIKVEPPKVKEVKVPVVSVVETTLQAETTLPVVPVVPEVATIPEAPAAEVVVVVPEVKAPAANVQKAAMKSHKTRPSKFKKS